MTDPTRDRGGGAPLLRQRSLQRQRRPPRGGAARPRPTASAPACTTRCRECRRRPCWRASGAATRSPSPTCIPVRWYSISARAGGIERRRRRSVAVGPSGKAYGVDFTPEMLKLARRNAVEAGASNAEFLEGRIEAVPLPDSSIDVVISNCVINLSADKAAVFAKMHRLLRPGGRVGVSDVVTEDHLTEAERAERGSYVWLHRRCASVSPSTGPGWTPRGSPTLDRVHPRRWRRRPQHDRASDQTSERWADC